MGSERTLDPPPPVRPARLVAAVCLHCGSTSPSTPAPDCAHGTTVRLADVTPHIADLVARIRRARHGIVAALATLRDVVELERLAGRAIVDDAPDVHPSANVVHLRRFELCDDDETTAKPSPRSEREQSPPRRSSPVAGAFELRPESPKPRVRRPDVKPPRRPAPQGAGELFEPDDPRERC